jgi:hypothetical protein
VGGLPIHSPNINTGRATYRNASMLLILFLYLIIGKVAVQAQWCCHRPPYGMYYSTTKRTPTYTSYKVSTTSTSIDSPDWLNKSYRFHHYILSDSTTSTNRYYPRNTITSALPETTGTEHSTPVFSPLGDTCFTNTDHNPCPVGYKIVGDRDVARGSTTDSSYSSTSSTLVQTTRSIPRCTPFPCTRTGLNECDPHPEGHCWEDRHYKRRTTSSTLAQVTSTEHLNQLDPRRTTSSISRKSRCLNNLEARPTNSSRTSGPFWWWVAMSLVNRSSKRSATSSTLAQVNSTDNSLFYPGNTPPPPDFLEFLDRITNMASNSRDDSSGNTPNSPEAPPKSDCETQPADILTPYTDTDKNPLDDLEPNPDYPVPSSARDEDMIPEEPTLPRSQTSDSTPKKAERGTNPAPDSTSTKMERVASPALDSTPTKPERVAHSPPHQARSSSNTPEKPPPKQEPPRCDRCGKTGFPGFCPYCSNMNNDGVGMF